MSDPDGRVLADADAAYDEALVLALHLLQGSDLDPALVRAVIVVVDVDGETVLELPLTEAMSAAPGSSGTRH